MFCLLCWSVMLRPGQTPHWVSGTEFAKIFWGDKPFCLRFDDVAIFSQPLFDLFVKLAKWGTHYENDRFW